MTRPAIPPGSARLVFSLALVLMTLWVYWPVVGFAFTGLDDPQYVTENPHVLEGLSLHGLVWAFSTFDAANWHPLTWISLMIDSSIGGGADRAGVYHTTNLFWHLLNTVLLFLALDRMTGRAGQSAFVAALFAVHPQHVESVAWVAERKDVLSATFWFLTLFAYFRHVARPSAGRYAAVTLSFACGLLAKPMLVTLPVVLLLLDFWPLGRFHRRSGRPTTPAGARPLAAPSERQGTWDGSPTRPTAWPLVREKLPLLAMALASSMITLVAQSRGGAVASLEAYPLWARAANALVSYATYLLKAVWPSDLAVLYPHPGTAIGAAMVVVSGAALVALTAFSLSVFRARPYLTVGWLWYLVTLVPVIGLVQVGVQSRADRYTYIPLIGIFVAVTWAVGDSFAALSQGWSDRHARASRGTAQSSPAARATAAGSRATAVDRAGSRATAACRTGSHATATGSVASPAAAPGTVATEDLPPRSRATGAGETAAGASSARVTAAGTTEAGASSARAAAAGTTAFRPNATGADATVAGTTRPGGSLTHAPSRWTPLALPALAVAVVFPLMTTARLQVGHWHDRRSLFARLTEVEPDKAPSHNTLGTILYSEGAFDEAFREFRRAIELDPGHAGAHNNLGMTLQKQGKTDEALREFHEAIRINASYALAHEHLAHLFLNLGRSSEAVQSFTEALRLDPKLAASHAGLASALFGTGDVQTAALHAREALRLEPRLTEGHMVLGAALLMQSDFGGAVEHFSQAVAIDPGMADAHANLAGALLGQARPEAAIAECREALRLLPAHTGARTNLGVALLKQGHRDEARREFSEVLRLSPDDARARRYLQQLDSAP